MRNVTNVFGQYDLFYSPNGYDFLDFDYSASTRLTYVHRANVE
jgi:hypothetical protein